MGMDIMTLSSVTLLINLTDHSLRQTIETFKSCYIIARHSARKGIAEENNAYLIHVPDWKYLGLKGIRVIILLLVVAQIQF